SHGDMIRPMRIRSSKRLTVVALKLFVISAGLAAATASLAARQSNPSAPAAKAKLTVAGVGLTTTGLDLHQLESMPRTTIKVREKQDTQPIEYTGVRLSDVLAAAGMKFGQNLRGERLADYLVAESPDGFRVVFALPELDPEFSDRIV